MQGLLKPVAGLRCRPFSVWLFSCMEDREIREINEIMNQCITGWNYFSNPRMFAEYGRQKGWEREIPATDTDNPPEKSMDGFVEVTEQMELPF